MRTVQAGDILLFRVSKSSNWLDRLIGWGQKLIHEAPTDAAYCHVAFVGPDSGYMYEARWPKIRNVALDWTAIEKNITVEVYRVKGITADQIVKIMAYAKSQIGRSYDVLAILTMGMIQFGKGAVCSQYAYESFLAGGVVLRDWTNLESPDDIAASSLLQKID